MAFAEYAGDFQDKFFDDDKNQLSSPDDLPINIIASQELCERGEEDEERRHTIIMLEVPCEVSDKDLEEYVDSRWPAEHCQHEYDCCAQWYQYSADIDRSGKFAKVTLAFFQNI